MSLAVHAAAVKQARYAARLAHAGNFAGLLGKLKPKTAGTIT
jgi:hypothetical protein